MKQVGVLLSWFLSHTQGVSGVDFRVGEDFYAIAI